MSKAKRQNSKSRKSMQNQHAKSPSDKDSETRKKSEWIGEQLRGIYNETLEEPIPERFSELLRQLEDKPGTKK